MSSDTDRLEREAETHRSNLDSTFDAIRDRLSVGQIVDEFSGYLKEGQGADTVKNLGRQVRDNPLALGLVGAGRIGGEVARRARASAALGFGPSRPGRRDAFGHTPPRCRVHTRVH